jgi:hypothetical protein
MSHLKSPSVSESDSQPISFSPDFVERVLREAKRKRGNSRRMRVFGLGAVLVAALTVVGRGPMHLRRTRPAPDTAALLAVADGDVAESELSSELPGELVAEEDADADPGIYFVPEPLDQADGQADDSDDSDLALFAQN